MEGSETLSYGDVTRCDVVSQPVGLLRFTETAIGFKQRSRGNDQDAIKPLKVPKEEIKGITWAKVTPIKCMLTVVMNDNATFSFSGLRDSDYQSIETFVKSHFSIDIKSVTLNSSGTTFGIASLEGTSVNFSSHGTPVFSLPFMEIEQCVATKQDVKIQLHEPDVFVSDTQHSLYEIRFNVPSKEAEENLAKKFQQQVSVLSNLSTRVTVNRIAELPALKLLQPRGSYDVDFFGTGMKFHGQSYNFSIDYVHVAALYDLYFEDKKETHYICIALDQSLRQGQTKYDYFVCAASGAVESTLVFTDPKDELNQKSKSEKAAKDEQSGDIDVEDAPENSAASALCGLLHRCAPSAPLYHSKDPIPCTLRTASGYLFFAEEAIIFVHKPVTVIKYRDIYSVQFKRVGTQKTFDFCVIKTDDSDLLFTGIDQSVNPVLVTNLSKHRIAVMMKDGTLREVDDEMIHELAHNRTRDEIRNKTNETLREATDEDSEDSEDASFDVEEQQKEDAENESSDSEDDEDKLVVDSSELSSLGVKTSAPSKKSGGDDKKKEKKKEKEKEKEEKKHHHKHHHHKHRTEEEQKAHDEKKRKRKEEKKKKKEEAKRAKLDTSVKVDAAAVQNDDSKKGMDVE